MERLWFPVRAENLVRHRSGTFYVQAMVGGKKIRQSLATKDLKVAKVKRDKLLESKRSAAVKEPTAVRTLGDALTLVANRLASNPRSKPRTLAHHREIEASLRKSLPCDLAGSAWTKDAATAWWRSYATRAASQANKGLSMAKKMAAVLVESGLRFDDPTKGLRRMSVKASAVDSLPSRRAALKVIASIKRQRKRVSLHVSQMVAFLLWSGLRKGEAQSVHWEDIGEDWLVVRDGKSGRRRVQVSASLRKLIGEMRHEGASGPVFAIKDPRGALKAACKRVGIPHLRVHDLRHLFATRAIEAGVDVPTVAKWLGHKDGGALAMRTYGHIRDEHSLEQARKLK